MQNTPPLQNDMKNIKNESDPAHNIEPELSKNLQDDQDTNRPHQSNPMQQNNAENHPSENDKPNHNPVIERDSEKIFALLEDRIIEAKYIIKRSPHLKQFGDTLYRVPWYLFIGNTDSQGKDLLQEANVNDPVASLNDHNDHPSLWTWWFLQSMIGIEVDFDHIGHPKDPIKREFWQKAIYLLQKKRPKLPINGVVALIDAQKLLESYITQDMSTVQEVGKSIRYMIDECQKNFYMQFPVSIIVTNCNALRGYDMFFSKLPKKTRLQALGHKFNIQSLDQRAYSYQLKHILIDMKERLDSIKLGILSNSQERENPYQIFDFPEEFSKLSQGLHAFCDALFGENPYQYKPFWRGLYFTSHASENKFITDVFQRFLPVDQPLANKR